MNVLLVVPWDQERGGVANVVNVVAQRLTARGHRVLFLHPGEPERMRRKTTKTGFEGRELNLRVPFVRAHPIRSMVAYFATLPRTVYQLLKLIRDERIDVVNVHYPLPAFAYFAICRMLRNFRLVVSAHGSDFMPGGRRPARQPLLVRWLVRASDLFTAPSQGYLDQILLDFPSARSKSSAIYNGIELTDFPKVVEHRSPFALCIAAHNNAKGIDVLLQALASCRSRGQYIPFVLAGDGPLRSEFEALACTLGVSDMVRFVGFQDLPALRTLLEECSFVVLPSRSESFGISLLEAMAVGRAVVGTRVGGIPEIIVDGVTGLVVPPEDPGALADAMWRLANDAALRKWFGDAGKVRVARHFTADVMADGYELAFSRR